MHFYFGTTCQTFKKSLKVFVSLLVSDVYNKEWLVVILSHILMKTLVFLIQKGENILTNTSLSRVVTSLCNQTAAVGLSRSSFCHTPVSVESKYSLVIGQEIFKTSKAVS